MTDTNHIEAEVSAVIKRLTGCPDIIGYGGESLAGEISRALSARASAGEGGEATPKALRMMANALSSRASYGRTTSFHAGTPADTKGTSDLMDSAAELLRRIADNLAAAPQPQEAHAHDGDVCQYCGFRSVEQTQLNAAFSKLADFNPGADEFTEALEVLRNHIATPPAHGDGEDEVSELLAYLERCGNGSKLCRDAAAVIRHLTARPSPVGDAVEYRMFDSQWGNVVNHANCYSDMSKEEAVAQAVKLTEQAMAANVCENKWPRPRDAAMQEKE